MFLSDLGKTQNQILSKPLPVFKLNNDESSLRQNFSPMSP